MYQNLLVEDDEFLLIALHLCDLLEVEGDRHFTIDDVKW